MKFNIFVWRVRSTVDDTLYLSLEGKRACFGCRDEATIFLTKESATVAGQLANIAYKLWAPTRVVRSTVKINREAAVKESST